MTVVAVLSLVTLAAAAAFTAGYIAGRNNAPDTYWDGFADGEHHQQLADRTPSLN
jgi:hypothetical protein